VNDAQDGNKLNSSCSPCVNKTCWKTCSPPEEISTIDEARYLRNCRVINGSLSIWIDSFSLSSRIIQKELEESFSDIVEIKGYLELRRTPITSFNFFKSLKVIGSGPDLARRMFSWFSLGPDVSLDLYDNPELTELFPDSQQILMHGALKIRKNPKLCFEVIEKFAAKGSYKVSSYASSQTDNCVDRTLCNYTSFEVKVELFDFTSAILTWDAVRLPFEDVQYVVEYCNAKDEFGKLVDHSRKSLLVVRNPAIDTIKFRITNLTPATIYTYFVRAFVVGTNKTTAYSDVSHFLTMPSVLQNSKTWNDRA